ncbi:MAG: 16S rRNA (guanine(527)-N(7))-methyltransferase RsmG [Gammaproteobacteria bacterium]
MTQPAGKAMWQEIASGLSTLGVATTPQAVDALTDYLALLAEWNRAYNLTAVRDSGEMVRRHVLDSATALPFLHGTRMLDAGSGAGLPGLVLAILAPQTQWVLAESTGKKARFLEHAARELGLAERVAVHAGRVEAHRDEEGFDTVTARALAELAQLLVWTAPHLASGGRLVALKGQRAMVEAELAALPSGWRSRVNPVTLPDRNAERCIVVVEREA